MMNITLSVDEQVAARAREAARKLGKSLNQVVRDYLEQLAGGATRSFIDTNASAQLTGCNVIFSEDLNTGETMAGVRIVNPFAEVK